MLSACIDILVSGIVMVLVEDGAFVIALGLRLCVFSVCVCVCMCVCVCVCVCECCRPQYACLL